MVYLDLGFGFGVWNLELEFGVWNLGFGIWNLEFLFMEQIMMKYIAMK